LCLAEVAKRYSQSQLKDSLEFSNPKDVANYYMEAYRNLKQEVLSVVILDIKNKFLRKVEVTKGSSNLSLFPIKDVLREILSYNGEKVILMHNHPSGDPTPSKDDIISTRNFKNACKTVGIMLIDHIIIGDNRYYSLLDNDLI